MKESAPKPSHALPGPIELYQEAIELYQKNLQYYFLLTLAPFIFYIPLNTNTPMYWMWFTLYMVLTSLSSLTLLFLLKTGSSKDSLKIAFNSALKQFFPYVWLQILLMFSLSGAFFLFFIPIFYVSTIYCLSIYIFVFENVGGIEALLRSYGYVKNNFWQVFGRMIAYTLVNIILMVISVVVNNSLRDSNMLMLGYIIISIIYAMVTPLQLLYSYSLYHNLQKQKTVSSLPSQVPAILLAVWGLVAPILLFTLGFLLLMIGLFTSQR